MVVIWVLIGGLLGWFVPKYFKPAIYGLFWLLGWNDRRRAKAYKAQQPLASFEVQGGRLEVFKGESKYNWIRNKPSRFKMGGGHSGYFEGIDRIGAATNGPDECEHGTDWAFDCEDCQNQPKGW